MQYFKLFIILSLTAFLSACGGGTTASKSKNTSIEIKLELPDNSKKRTKTNPRFTVGNTSISQVLIGYGPTGDEQTTMDVTTAAENQSSVTIPDLEAGKEYSFTVSAFSGTDTLVCQGGDSLTIVPNTVSDLTLTCSFEDKYAIENFVFSVEAKGVDGTLSESDMDDYVADESDFGVYNGMDRSTFITDFVTKRAEMKSNGLNLISVQMLNPRMKLPKSKMKTSSKTSEDTATAKVKYIYSDGSYKFEELWAAKIDDEWKLIGNGHNYDLAIENQAAQLFSTSGQTTPVKVAGISVGAGTVSADKIASFTMSGNGINSAGYLIIPDPNFIYAKLTSSASSYFFNEINENMTMYANAAAVNDGDPYSFAITTKESGSVAETLYVQGDGITSSYMSGNVFPTAAMASSSSCTKSITVTLPTAYTPSWAEIQFFTVSDQGTKRTVKGRVPLTTSVISVDLGDIIPATQNYGEMKITAYDSAGRAFSTFYSFDNLGLATGTACVSGGGDDGDDDDNVIVNGYYKIYDIFDEIQSQLFSTAFKDFKKNADNSFSALLSTNLLSPGYNDFNGYFEPLMANFDADGDVLSAYSIEHVNPDSANTVSRVKLLTASDGTQYIVARNYEGGDYFVTLMKISSSGDSISWIKKYQSADTDYNQFHKFIDAALVSDSVNDTDTSDDIVLLIKGKNNSNSYNANTMLLKVSSSDGNIMSSNLIEATNTDGGVLPIKLAVVKPYDTVVVLAYTYAPDTQNHSTLSLIALDSSLAYQSSKEIYEGYENMIDVVADNGVDDTLMNFVDMAVGINGKIYLSLVPEDYSNAYAAEISTDFNTGSYNINSVSLIALEDTDSSYTEYQAKIAVTKTPSETENLIYYYTLASGVMSGDMQMILNTQSIAQLSESAFVTSGEGLNWVYTLPDGIFFDTHLYAGAASSVFIVNTGMVMSMNVDGEVSDADLENADDRLSFETMSVSLPSQVITYNTSAITDMNATVLGSSLYNMVERPLLGASIFGSN